MLINPATVVVFVLFILSLHSRFRGLGQFCLDNKIMRLGSFFLSLRIIPFFTTANKRCYVLISKESLHI